LTKVDWGKASMDDYHFWESFKDSAKNAEKIRFDISDFDVNYTKKSITKKEFEYIINDPDLLAKTIFIKDGKEMVWNKKVFFECK
jgi:hypothetical protein